MPSKIYSAAIAGLDAKIIEIETEVSPGLRCFTLVGLPDKAVQESRERIGVALKDAGFRSPYSQPQRVLVNLAPADIKKEGSLYDLPIALSYLLASKQTSFPSKDKLFVGELALDGKLRSIKGILPFTLKAKEQGFSEIILPRDNAAEAALIEGIDVIGAECLDQIINHLKGESKISPFKVEKKELLRKTDYSIDIGWIKGQKYAKRALEITAAGGHNLLMTGPPGTGKTILAKSICSILPQLSFKESLETTKIYSIVGLLRESNLLITSPPFRAPHHTSSEAALIGGGNPPRPGEITLAHQGVLFLDEFPEFHRNILESLRQPLEEHKITILRARHQVTFPAKFILLAAANPCPCGFHGDPDKKCTCSTSQIQKYQRKLSGPLIDRIDLFIKVPQVRYEKLVKPDDPEESQKIRKRVSIARKIQKQRLEREEILTNSEMNIPQVKEYCPIPSQSQKLLKRYVNTNRLSIRGFHRVLKTARTIADLDNSEKIKNDHLAEALMYRLKESKY